MIEFLKKFYYRNQGPLLERRGILKVTILRVIFRCHLAYSLLNQMEKDVKSSECKELQSGVLVIKEQLSPPLCRRIVRRRCVIHSEKRRSNFALLISVISSTRKEYLRQGLKWKAGSIIKSTPPIGMKEGRQCRITQVAWNEKPGGASKRLREATSYNRAGRHTKDYLVRVENGINPQKP